jgi:Rrf2 family protein
MILSQKCKYALKAIMELAARDSAEPIKIQQIANAQSIPIKFLEAILNDLRHSGIVASKRGNDGGYYLTRKPSDVTVGEIILQIQGPAESLISENAKPTAAYGENAISKLCQDMVEEINRIYNQTTFADLMEWEMTSRTGVTNYMI